MVRFLGVDSLAFLSLDGLYRAVGHKKRHRKAGFCDACFTGEYMSKVTDRIKPDKNKEPVLVP